MGITNFGECWLTSRLVSRPYICGKRVADWVGARTMFIQKGYMRTESELKVKAHIPENEWIGKR